VDSSISYSDSFSELVRSEDRFTEVKDALKQLCKVDLDKLISSVRVRIKLHSESSLLTTMQLASNETREASSARTASSRVTQMLNLKDVMRHLPALQKALVGSKSELLKIICNVRYDTLTAFSTYAFLVDVV
jgi:DNA mismatch repair protein MSH4